VCVYIYIYIYMFIANNFVPSLVNMVARTIKLEAWLFGFGLVWFCQKLRHVTSKECSGMSMNYES
jgi:hypothetical protein